MQLTIIKKNKLSTFILPDRIDGSYWITDFENGRKINLLSVEATDGKWQLISNNDACIVGKNDTMVPYAILSDYSFFIIRNNYKNEKYYLYCSPVNEKTYKEYSIPETSKLTVGSGHTDICCKMGGIPSKAYEIEKDKEMYYYINILDKKASIYVNEKRVLTRKRIEYGDIIFTFGLKIILMRKNGVDYLLINNPNNTLEYNASYVNVNPAENVYVEDYAVLSDDSLYSDENFFYRTPYFYKQIEPMQVNLDTPPSKKEDEKTPAILTIGPMITMSMVSVVSLMSTLNSVGKGERDSSSAMSSIIMCVAMLASSLLWPLLTRWFQKMMDKSYERKRQRLYKKYIAKKEKEIEENQEIQKNILIENTFSVTKCQEVIKNHDVSLWQKRVSDDDFLSLPVGIGNLPMLIDIKYPEEHFSMTTDNLIEIARGLGKKERILENVPISYSFYENMITGIVGDPYITKEFIDRLLLQLMANYSYDEVKLVTFTSTDNEVDWDYVKSLPHSWSNDKSLRYFGSSNDDYREIIYNLEKVYNARKEANNSNKNSKELPQYVIVTDAIKSIDNFDFIKKIMTDGKDFGFTFIILVDKITALPNECKTFINVSNEICSISSSILNQSKQEFKIDFSPTDELYNCAKELANIPINIKNEVEASLPDSFEFLEMYQVGKVEQLNISERWRKNNPILSLQAPIGIGKSGEVINLDLHEKYHGPHGLIAGTTGSGKSEFIITYILSLAVNYHPNEVQMILIDYKGGSLAGAFVNENYKLPHIAGTITNLDGNELERSLASIESEVKRRQSEFNKARNLTGESSIDIYKYQKLYREGRLKDMQPISHLFIISDEFAELKEQQSEFMEKLISVARVGRSLGVHLILATQKPGGVVDSQIWSNTRFRVCLKVQDTGDSQEVLKKPDAAYLKKTGRFYLQVGYDEVYTLGQAAWAGAQYFPSNSYKKSIDTSINMVNNIGFVLTTKDIANAEDKTQSLGETLPNVVKYLAEVAEKENIQIRKLWLDKIPEKIYIDKLKQKYNFQRELFNINPIIGEYDDPASQMQYKLSLPLTKFGNAAIYGIAGSGKEKFIKTVIYSCMTSYAPEEVNFYILDFGSETLRIFESSPYVGNICYLSDFEKVNNLFKLINNEIERRKTLFSSAGGSLNSYYEQTKQMVPNLVVIINGFEAFNENYEELAETLSQITRDCTKYGIFFIITAIANNSIRMKLRQNISLVYALQQNDDLDFSDILGNCRGKVPAKYMGRGLFKKENIYEFQTASVCEEDEDNYLKNYCKKISELSKYKPLRIPVLPKCVDETAVADYLQNYQLIPIGVNKEKLVVEQLNIKKNVINLISSFEIENCYTLTNALINEIIYMGGYHLYIVNTSEQEISIPEISNDTYVKNFDKLFDEINEYIETSYQEYEQNNYNDDILLNKEKKLLLIYGIQEFINKLSQDNKNKLGDLFKKANQLGLLSVLVIDAPESVKNYAYEDWFKSSTDLSRGIWIGSGITDQNLLKVNKFDREDREEIPNDLGYIVVNGKLSRIKLLEQFNKKR